MIDLINPIGVAARAACRPTIPRLSRGASQRLQWVWAYLWLLGNFGFGAKQAVLGFWRRLYIPRWIFLGRWPAFSPSALPRENQIQNTALGHHHPVTQSGPAIMVLVIFIALTLWLIIAQSWAIRATGSIAVRGDRAHYIADLLANIFVIIGIAVATYTQFGWADSLVGGLMALWLLFTAFQIAKLAWGQLMDRELNPDERRAIKRIAMADPQVRAVTDLRTRAAGPHLHVQMRLDLDETLSLAQAHEILLETEKRIIAAFPAADILIHPHPAGCSHTHGNSRFRTTKSS